MNEKAKRTLLRHIPYGLYVIGVGRGKCADAFTASWLMQTSMDPPLVAIGVRRGSAALALIRRNRILTVNFLPRTARDVLRFFARSDRGSEARLGRFTWNTARTGAPVLDLGVGYLDCRVCAVHARRGDHALVIAEIVDANLFRDEPPIVMADTGWKYAG